MLRCTRPRLPVHCNERLRCAHDDDAIALPCTGNRWRRARLDRMVFERSSRRSADGASRPGARRRRRDTGDFVVASRDRRSRRRHDTGVIQPCSLARGRIWGSKPVRCLRLGDGRAAAGATAHERGRVSRAQGRCACRADRTVGISESALPAGERKWEPSMDTIVRGGWLAPPAAFGLPDQLPGSASAGSARTGAARIPFVMGRSNHERDRQDQWGQQILSAPVDADRTAPSGDPCARGGCSTASARWPWGRRRPGARPRGTH